MPWFHDGLVLFSFIKLALIYSALLRHGRLYVWIEDYSKLSIKRPALLNDLVWIFKKSLHIKQPGQSQKTLIILFYFWAATANFWSLLNDLVWIFGKSLYQTTGTIFFSNSRSVERPGFIIETLEYSVENCQVVLKV